MFKIPFSFNGRIRRTEYALSFIIYVIAAILLNLASERGDGDTQILTLFCYIPLLWFLWAQGAKRCHDLGKTGLFQIVPFYFFVMIFADGFHSDNRFGQDPKGRSDAGELAATE